MESGEPMLVEDEDKGENAVETKTSSSVTETSANAATSAGVITIGDDDEIALLAEDPTEDNKMDAKVEDEDILLLDDDDDNGKPPVQQNPGKEEASDKMNNEESAEKDEITEKEKVGSTSQLMETDDDVSTVVMGNIKEENVESIAALEDVEDDKTGIVLLPQSTESSSFVIPLVSPKIPSLAYKAGIPAGRVADKEVRPTVPPPPQQRVNGPTDSVFNLMAYSKSIASALAKPAAEDSLPAASGEKRKYSIGCANVYCNKANLNGELVMAKKAALTYYHFNVGIKKVYKICNECNLKAEDFMEKAVRTVKENDAKTCVFDAKTEPQGQDSDVIEVIDGEEEVDPTDILAVETEDKEVVELTSSLDKVLGDILSSIDLKSQIEKCEKKSLAESRSLDNDWRSLDSKLAFVEKQVIEAKKIYDKVTGYNQPVPVVLEQLDIDSSGRILKSKADNDYLEKVGVRFNTKQNNPVFSPKGQPSQKGFGDAGRKRVTEEIEVVLPGSKKAEEAQKSTILAPTPKVIPRVLPKPGSVVYALSRTLLHFWLKGEVIEVLSSAPGKSPEFVVRFEPTRRGHPVRDGKTEGTSRLTKQVTAKQLAYNIPCPFVLPVGSRIIAKFRDELNTEPIGNGQFYAGVIAEPPKNTNNYRYLVFFDDGYAQYVSHREVLMVHEASKEVWADVHPDSSEFIKNYVQKYPERPMVRMSQGQIVTTEWNGKWWMARVIELDSSLVKMKFENDGRCEWIYRGSTRLSPLFQKQTRQKIRTIATRRIGPHGHRGQNQAMIEYNYGEEGADKQNEKPVAKKSTGIQQVVDKEFVGDVQRLSRLDYGEFEGTIIKRPVPDKSPRTKDFVPHNCNSSCVFEYNENDRDFKKISPLAVPLHLGWTRDIAKNPRRNIFYRAPCGRRIRDSEELYNFLTATRCEIPIDQFCFDLAVDCLNEFRHARQHSFLPDLTYGKEQVTVQVVNAFDFDYPPYVEYSSFRIPGKGVHLNTNDEFLVDCDCEDDCRDKSKCSCWQLTFSGISFTKLNNEEYPTQGYEFRRLKDHIVSGIYECNSRCKCSKTCCNRVVQNGLKVPLQVFKTAAKGWGIRPLFDIPEGSFICIYAGQVLTESSANEDGKQFGDEYLAELDYIECNEQIKADYESDVTDIEAEEPTPEKKKRGKKGRGDDSDGEIDSHALDSSYRVRSKVPLGERTVSTRGTNRQNNGSSQSSKSSNSSDEDEGTRMRSRFNPDTQALVEKNKARKEKEEKQKLSLREYFGKEELCYIMDAKTKGNIGRYLNHSCQPNVFVQNVFVDTHDLRFPWVAFFASKHIRAGSELTWDYNYDIGSVPDKVLYCYCGSAECRGRLL